MTEQNERLEREGNIKRIGILARDAEPGVRLFVLCKDWLPMVGDMFNIDDGGQGLRNIVSKVLGTDVDVAELELGYAMIPQGQYRNVDVLPKAGAVLYQPAGNHLKAIWESWLETAR